MVKLASNGILGFSSAPLRLALSMGVFLAIASVIYGVVVIVLKLAGVSVVPGYASLLFAITFLSGIQLAVMGMVGLYVGRIYDEARARPLYVVRERHGFGDADGPVIWQPTEGAQAHNGRESTALRP
jgi:dolichol-phosphate mannosyltransferase